MVPVPDVLRHIAERIPHEHDDSRMLIRFLADMQEGRLRLFHPSTSLMSTLTSLPSVTAEYLFLAGYNQAEQKYHGRFFWFSAVPRCLADCQAVQDRLNELMSRPGWQPYDGDVGELPLPTSRLIGGLLVCRNGDAWITLAITPTSITPAATLVHIALAVPTTLMDLMVHPEDINVGQAHPMIELARKTVDQITEPRRHLLLAAFFDELQRRRLQMVGAMPGEEDAFFNPDNNLHVAYVFAMRMFRDGENDFPEFWSNWEEFEPYEDSLAHCVEERLQRFLRRRRSIVPDAELPRFSSKVPIPAGRVHAGWVITRHPYDDLQSRLFVSRALDPKVGLACLEEAVHRMYIWR